MSSSAAARPKIAILLCTHNGETFLKEQLDSYAKQTWEDWFVIASDDASQDRTLEILKDYQQRWAPGKLQIITGPARGFAENFMSVTRYVAGQADYYAWSDQDDIWYPDKLERAVRWLEDVPAQMPALYSSRTLLVSSDNREITLSMLPKREPGFANALIQNICGGNTMVFNPAACYLLAETTQDTPLVAHDWWAYILITGCGGRVLYDPDPSLRYRQHSGNLIGENLSCSARLFRIRQLFRGRFRDWNSLHVQSLEKYENRLTRESAETLRLFAGARKCLWPMSLWQLKRSGVHRQTRMSNFGLFLAATFRKI